MSPRGRDGGRTDRTHPVPSAVRRLLGVIVVVGIGAAAPCAAAQQVPDTLFTPEVPTPTHRPGEGPVVAIDEAHGNFHTLEGRYATFGWLARGDGYRVRRFEERFTPGSLAGVDVLVVSNALAARNAEDWALPTPSAFDAEEIAAVERWVEGGGSLLLVADHMPFPGAAAALARAFGVAFTNGFAVDTTTWDDLVFRAADGTLAPHPITSGAGRGAALDSVVSFTGQAFRPLSDGVRPLLVLPEGVVSLTPDTAWVFHERTPTTDVGGWLQGAAVEHGSGRVVVLGEAAMLTAQLAGPDRVPMGMNAPGAEQNAAFVLAVLRWLGARER